MAFRLAPVALLAVLLLSVLLVSAPRSSSADQPVRADGPVLIFRERESAGPLFIPPPAAPGDLRPMAASFQVTYTGFTPEARAAFQYAVDIWASQLNSAVPIAVDAQFTPLQQGVLGSARAFDYWANFTNAPRTQTFYPVALANKLSGTDRAGSDIVTRFNSNYPDWYFGTDGRPGSEQFDFVSVVLHELAHGLGFAGSAFEDSGAFYYGLTNDWPIIYDRYVRNAAGNPILSFPSGSAALGSQLTGGNLFFNAPATNAANGGAPARLYAPSPWRQGSSYSHLDETTFGRGTVNSLMTPFIGRGEAIHNPGAVTLAMLGDMGWVAASSTPTLTPTATATARSLQALSVVVRDLRTATPTVTATRTVTPTLTATRTVTPTATLTRTPTP
ncbi:MAG: hypothetical protein U0556_03130 [Dehalococcoidia bacterium]